MARHRKKKSTVSHGDVSIADYADNKTAKTRISKFRPVLVKPAQLDVEHTDIHDADLDDKVILHQPAKKSTYNEPDDDHLYNQYPIDIWDAISKHIQPEDISSFSRICRSTASICRTAIFWKQLYHRFYNSESSANLPVRLQPACMVRIGGLRTCTIRSLFHLHPTLKERLAKDEQQSISGLRRRECIATWLVRVKDVWHYCFKLKEPLAIGSRMERSERLRRQNVFEKVQRDIFQNPDEGCKLLVVKMSAMRPLPNLFGQQSYLQDVKMSLTRGCVKHRLTMEFGGTGREIVANVVYEPVDEVRVLDWWTPAYHSFEANMAVDS